MLLNHSILCKQASKKVCASFASFKEDCCTIIINRFRYGHSWKCMYGSFFSQIHINSNDVYDAYGGEGRGRDGEKTFKTV